MFKNSIQKRSEAIFASFTDIITELNAVNQDAAVEVNKKQTVVTQLTEEIESLTSTVEANKKLAGKISDFLA